MGIGEKERDRKGRGGRSEGKKKKKESEEKEKGSERIFKCIKEDIVNVDPLLLVQGSRNHC